MKFPEGAIGKVLPESTRENAEGLVTSSVLVPKLTEACLDLIALIHDDRENVVTRLDEEAAVTDTALTSYSGAKKKESEEPDLAPGSKRLLGLGTRHRLAAEEAEVKSRGTSATTPAKHTSLRM